MNKRDLRQKLKELLSLVREQEIIGAGALVIRTEYTPYDATTRSARKTVKTCYCFLGIVALANGIDPDGGEASYTKLNELPICAAIRDAIVDKKGGRGYPSDLKPTSAIYNFNDHLPDGPRRKEGVIKLLEGMLK